MADIMELREKQQKHVADAREALESIDSKTDEARAKELEEQHDRAMSEYDSLEEQIKRRQKIEDAEERLHNIPDPVREERSGREVTPSDDEKPEIREVFRKYLRGGAESLDSEERKAIREFRAQGTSSGSVGGYLFPDEFQAEVMETLQAWGPMLNPGVTRQITTATGATLEWPTLDDTSNKGSLLGENTQDSDSDLSFGQKTLGAYKYTSGIFKISEELLQDSAINPEQLVQEAMVERIGRIVNEHLTVGSGSGQPNGIVTAAGTGVTATATGTLDADEIIDLQHSVDPLYRQQNNVRWMFNDSTLQALRKLKDGDGNYLWQQPDVRAGAPAMLLGFEYDINQDMADVGTSNDPILFGNFNRYIVRRVKEFTIRRLVERYADFHQIGFVGFGRFDGELIDDSAVKKLTMAAA